MIEEEFEKGGDSLSGMYIRSIADIPKLYAILPFRPKEKIL